MLLLLNLFRLGSDCGNINLIFFCIRIFNQVLYPDRVAVCSSEDYKVTRRVCAKTGNQDNQDTTPNCHLLIHKCTSLSHKNINAVVS